MFFYVKNVNALVSYKNGLPVFDFKIKILILFLIRSYLKKGFFIKKKQCTINLILFDPFGIEIFSHQLILMWQSSAKQKCNEVFQ